MSLAGHLAYGLREGFSNGLRRWQHTRRWDAFLHAHPVAPGECGLLAREGIGDHLIPLAFAPAIQSVHGLKVAVLAGNPRFDFLPSLFSPSPVFAPWKDSPEDYARAGLLASGAYYCTHFPGYELFQAVGVSGFHFIDAYRCRLGLPPHTRPVWPRPPSTAELADAARLLASHHLPAGRTVLLAAEARSTPVGGIPPRLWTDLAAALRARGLSPVFNLGPGSHPPEGFPGLAIPLPLLRAAATIAGAVCSVRSGLSDLLCNTSCRRAVLYSKSPYGGGSLLQGTTFSRYHLDDPPFELEADEASHPAVVSALLDRWL